MSINNYEKSLPTFNYMEQEFREDKVNIEEASINLGCIKKELDEEEFEYEKTQYKFTLSYENIFGGNSKYQRNEVDSLIGFLDNDIIMDPEIVKLEYVKEENKDIQIIKQSYCNRCHGNYDRYCPNCSSLSHILNNITANINESDINTAPINILEIREISGRRAVFALKTLSKGIILGPFEGIVPIESTNGCQWKIKDGKLLNHQNGNWMKYIASVPNYSSRNLDVFQFNGILYFETSREIQEGEELLVCYGEDEEVLKSEKEEFYFVPVKKEEYPKVFACTLCCLGFCLQSCLMEHKSKCPQRDSGCSFEDFEVIQCHCCNVWLEKHEYHESHGQYCLNNYGLYRSIPNFQRKTANEVEEIQGNCEISTPIYEIDENKSYLSSIKVIYSKYLDASDKANKKEHKCPKCSFRTNYKNNLKKHLNTHNGIKAFECHICKKRLSHKDSLKFHLKNKHLNASEKEYKCSDCSYQTNHKGNLRTHLDTHNDIKPLNCTICKKIFTLKSSLKRHIKIHHSNAIPTKYKCSECSYETIHKGYLRIHLNTHSGIKPYECGACKKTFSKKRNLILHIKNKHTTSYEKEHKCSMCSYQTNYRCDLKKHLNTHADIKPFECNICKIRFTQKRSLSEHMENKHSNTNEKEFKCSKCSYQTNYKGSIKRHLNMHNNIKPFECECCKKRFSQKSNLLLHVQSIHTNKDEKQHKCPECSYQTHYKYDLKNHLITHNDIKAFECDICKKRFSLKTGLKNHIKNQHSNTDEKKYKCPECSYQTNVKGQIKGHLNTHNDIKPHQCVICKKGYSHESTLKYHIKNEHTNNSEKEHKCSECSYETNHKSNLRAHLNRHKDIKPFKCDICKTGFTQKCSLSEHVENKHSNTSESKY